MKNYKRIFFLAVSTMLFFVFVACQDNAQTRSQKLFSAIESDNIVDIENLINKGVDFEKKNKEGKTVIQLAVELGKLEVFKLLKDKGANIFVENSDNQNLGILAAKYNRPEILAELIDTELNFNLQDIDKNTALIHAANDEKLKALAILLKKRPRLKYYLFNNNNKTAMTQAVYDKQFKAVRLMAAFGVINPIANRALLQAIEKGSLIRVINALKAGAFKNTKSKDKKATALALAILGNENKIANFLINKRAENNMANEQLIIGAKKGDLELVKLALKSKADINYKDEFESSAIRYAFDNNHTKVYKYLKDKGALFLIANIRLIEAAEEGDINKMKIQLREGANINTRGKDRTTALMIVVSKGYKEATKFLISKNADVNKQDKDGYSALLWAAQDNRIEILEILLKAKPNVNIQNKVGYTPLITASILNHIKVVEMLVDAKADVNIPTNTGGTAAYWAALREHYQIVEILVDAGAIDPKNLKILVECAQTGDIVRAKNALAAKVDLNMRNEAGYTPIMFAANAGQLPIIKLLVKHKVNIDIPDKDGYTPLIIAAYRGRTDVVQYLLSQNANVHKRHKSGRTALMIATWKGSIEMVKSLLEKNANVNAQDRNGWTSLMFAVNINSLEKVKLLIKAKANINLKNRRNKTALYWAKKKHYTSIIEYLESKNAL